MELTALGAVTLLAAALRLVDLDWAGFRIDEGYTLMFTRQPWQAVVGLDGHYDMHPPLFYVLAKAAGTVFPETVAARAVAAVAGTLTIPVAYLLGRRLVDGRVGLGAAALLAVSPLHVEFSRDGRMYAPVVLLVACGWLALLHFVESGRGRWAALYGAAILAALYTDYSAGFGIAPQLAVVLWTVRRAPRRGRWLLVALGAAAAGYAPWLIELWRSLDEAAGWSHREDWYAASWPHLAASTRSFLGLHGRTVSAGGHTPDLWARWPDLRPALILLAVPALAVGLATLRRRPGALAVALLMILAPPLVAVALSQVSPGYAARTVMAALLGVALAASGWLTRRPVARGLRAVGGASWLYLLVVSILTLPSTYEVGSRSEWPLIARDLDNQSALGKPIVVFSTAGMLTDMLDLYGGERLEGADVLTLLDGQREEELGYTRWLDRGPTLAEIDQGALDYLLPPDDPTKDAVWVILRFGGGREIPRELNKLGYQQIGAFRYSDTTLYLYARPGARLGSLVEADAAFRPSDDPSQGWQVSESRITTRSVGDDGLDDRELVMIRDRGSATLSFSPGGAGLVTVETAVRARGNEGRVVIRCKSPDGTDLFKRQIESGDSSTDTEWQTLRFAERCPEGTALVTLRLARYGTHEVGFRHVRVQISPDVASAENR